MVGVVVGVVVGVGLLVCEVGVVDVLGVGVVLVVCVGVGLGVIDGIIVGDTVGVLSWLSIVAGTGWIFANIAETLRITARAITMAT